MYEVTHTQVDSLLASYKCCKIEGSRPRTLPDRLFHLLCLVGLAYRNRDPSSASRNRVKSNGRIVGKASVRKLMDSPHRRIRAILQAKGGHMWNKDVATILCHLPTIPEYIHMLISLFGQSLKLVIKVQIFACHFHLSSIIWFTKISLMQNDIKNHKTTHLLHLFMILKVIWVKCAFYSQRNPTPP